MLGMIDNYSIGKVGGWESLVKFYFLPKIKRSPRDKKLFGFELLLPFSPCRRYKYKNDKYNIAKLLRPCQNLAEKIVFSVPLAPMVVMPIVIVAKSPAMLDSQNWYQISGKSPLHNIRHKYCAVFESSEYRCANLKGYLELYGSYFSLSNICTKPLK